jgi:hypothetical protein
MTATIVASGVWALLGACAASAAVWWPEHAILKGTIAHALRGTAMLSMIFVSPVALTWLWIRHVAWHVGPDGIGVYRRGRWKRSFDWSEIITLLIWPSYAVARSAARPIGEEIFFLGAEDIAWLREIANDRLRRRGLTIFLPRDQ